MAENKLDQEVTLYYLGGLENKERGMSRAYADGRSFALPSAGGHLRITRRAADQLIAKHKYRLRNGDYISLFTYDARVAKRVVEGMNVRDAQTMASTLSSVSVEALLAEAQRRGLKIQADEEAEDPKKPESKSAKTGRPSKKAETEEKSKNEIDELIIDLDQEEKE